MIRTATNLFILLGCSQLLVAQDGALDPTFGAGGLALVDTESYDGRAIAVQADGRIVVGGSRHAGTFDSEFVIARFLSDGTPDPGFGTDGIATVSFGTGYDECRALVIQPDGKILAAGLVEEAGDFRIGVARLNADGFPDLSFSGDGRKTIWPSTLGASCTALVLRPDGRILAVGRGGSQLALGCLNADGSMYTAFGGGDGVLTMDFGSQPNSSVGNCAVLRADGSLLVGGGTNTYAQCAMACFDYGGQLVPSFGIDGVVITNAVPGWLSSVGRVLELPNGNIVLAGTARTFPVTDQNFVLARYSPTGILDPTFGTGGIVVTDLDSMVSGWMDMIAQPDDRLLLCSSIKSGTSQDGILIRYNADGSLDNSFGVNGVLTFDFFGDIDLMEAAALQPDLKVVVSGMVRNGPDDAISVTRHFTGMNIGILEPMSPEVRALIYPVPVSTTARLEYTLPSASVIDMELRDVQGRLVRVLLSNATRSAGAHSETIDVSGLLAGHFTVVLRNGSGRTSVSVVKE